MKRILFTLLFLLISVQSYAATKTFYFNHYYSNPPYFTNAANAIDNSTATYANIAAQALTLTTGYVMDGNTCDGTSYGTITSVVLKNYIQVSKDTAGVDFINYLRWKDTTFSGNVNHITNDFGPAWSDVNITNSTNHPVWGTDWSEISDLELRRYLFGSPNFPGAWAGLDGGDSSFMRFYVFRLEVTYTPAASTISWSSPASSSRHYRAGSGVAISGTAANANGVHSVQYKVDAGAWVTCTGTTAWSATIPQSALTHGSHTINTRVRDNSTDYAYTTTTSRTIIQSPLPAQGF